MQALTCGVLIAGAGIFYLVGLEANDPLDGIAGVIACVLGGLGAELFIRGVVTAFRQPDEVPELRAK